MKLQKRVIGIEPTTFSLGSCRSSAQTVDVSMAYSNGKACISDTGIDSASNQHAYELSCIAAAWSTLLPVTRQCIMHLLSVNKGY
jgi:hypothetical protein